MTNPVPVSEHDMKRFVAEIVANSGTGGIDESALEAACDEFIEMNIDAAALSLWHDGAVKFAWSNGAMMWSLT